MNRLRVVIVAAMTSERVIGRHGEIPWHIPEDLRLFRELTTGHTVLMGRRTFESIGRPLPERINIVVSRTMTEGPGVEVCRSFEAALARAERLGRQVFVIGGESIYRQALPVADAMVISMLRENCQGDAFFPEFDERAWRVAKEEEYRDFTRTWYERRGEARAGGAEAK